MLGGERVGLLLYVVIKRQFVPAIARLIIGDAIITHLLTIISMLCNLTVSDISLKISSTDICLQDLKIELSECANIDVYR